MMVGKVGGAVKDYVSPVQRSTFKLSYSESFKLAVVARGIFRNL